MGSILGAVDLLSKGKASKNLTSHKRISFLKYHCYVYKDATQIPTKWNSARNIREIHTLIINIQLSVSLS